MGDIIIRAGALKLSKLQPIQEVTVIGLRMGLNYIYHLPFQEDDTNIFG